ncbi:MAG: hypothetical protein R3178_04600 [Rhodothermales bacterium]|nr:hypothetical protein [Rhodothermales bacterium]
MAVLDETGRLGGADLNVGDPNLIARPTWFARLWKGAVEVSPLETQLVHRFVREMPPDFRPSLEAQIRSANLIQRDPGWTELRFYTMVSGSVDRSGLPVLPILEGEVKLLSITFAVSNEDLRHVSFWAVDRHFVMMNLDRSIERCADGKHFDLIGIRQSWRSNTART